MATTLKNVIKGDREWDSRTQLTPPEDKIVTFFYDLDKDRFSTFAPPTYTSKNDRIVFPGHAFGFKQGIVGQFNYCFSENIAYMVTTKSNEMVHSTFFLHRVLRMKKKRSNGHKMMRRHHAK